MTLDPKMIQWIASALLLIVGVQSLASSARHRGMGGGLRALSILIALASAGFGVFMVINLLGAKA
jgi:hypothetical protein